MNRNVAAHLNAAGIQDDVLAKKMSSYLLCAKSDNTVKKYYSSYKRWQIFCQRSQFVSTPAQPIHVAIYLTELLDSKVSHSVITSAMYAIKWVHKLNNFYDPTDNAFVKGLFETSKRLRSKPTVKKDTISPELIVDLCNLYERSTDLLVIRDLCMIVIAYAGFLRYDELSALKCDDLVFHDSYVVIHIEKSKTDQYRQGNELIISKGVTSACPYNMLKRYLEMTGMGVDCSLYLFRPCFRSGVICKLIYKNKQLSYTRARECIVSRLQWVAPNLNLGLHSLRASGATSAINGGANERCVMKHGRWRCTASKDGYIQDSLDRRLHITQSLGF